MSFPPPTPRQARIIWMAVTGIAVAALVALVAGLVWGMGWVLRHLSPVLWPLAIAGVLAYLLDPLVDYIEGKGTRRSRAISWVFALAILIVVALFGSVVPQIVSESRDLVRRVPVYVHRLEDRVHKWVTDPPKLLRSLLKRDESFSGAAYVGGETNDGPESVVATPDFSAASQTNSPSLSELFGEEQIKTATGWLAKILPQVGSWLFGQVGRFASWFGVLVGLALIPIYAYYFLLEKRAIASRWTNYLPVADSGFKQELVFVLNSINNYLISYFRGQVLVAICVGILYGIGFSLIGLPYAVLIGAAAVFLTMIPYLGSIMVCVAALIIAALQFGDWWHVLMVLIVYSAVHLFLENTVIAPRILGGRVGLHPVTIIIALMVGMTLLGGVLGGILAIPFTAALRVIMFRYVWKKRELEGMPQASLEKAP